MSSVASCICACISIDQQEPGEGCVRKLISLLAVVVGKVKFLLNLFSALLRQGKMKNQPEKRENAQRSSCIRKPFLVFILCVIKKMSLPFDELLELGTKENIILGRGFFLFVSATKVMFLFFFLMTQRYVFFLSKPEP